MELSETGSAAGDELKTQASYQTGTALHRLPITSTSNIQVTSSE